MQLQYACESVEASLPAAEGNHPTVGLSAPKQHDHVILLQFYQTFFKTNHSQTLTMSLSSLVLYRTQASLHRGLFTLIVTFWKWWRNIWFHFPHMLRHIGLRNPLHNCNCRLSFTAHSESHILSVSNIYRTPKPSTGPKAPLLTLKNSHYNAGFFFCVCVFCHPEKGEAQ